MTNTGLLASSSLAPALTKALSRKRGQNVGIQHRRRPYPSKQGWGWQLGGCPQSGCIRSGMEGLVPEHLRASGGRTGPRLEGCSAAAPAGRSSRDAHGRTQVRATPPLLSYFRTLPQRLRRATYNRHYLFASETQEEPTRGDLLCRQSCAAATGWLCVVK